MTSKVPVTQKIQSPVWSTHLLNNANITSKYELAKRLCIALYRKHIGDLISITFHMR